MIPRRTVDRRLDLLDETKRFGGKAGVFDQVARETDELRRELVDRAHHFGGILDIAFVMEVSDMNEPAWPASIEIEVRHAERSRFDETGIGAERGRQGQRG